MIGRNKMGATNIGKLAVFLRALPQASKITVVILADAVTLSLVVLLSFALRISDFSLPQAKYLHLYILGPIISIAVMGALSIYRASSRGHSEHLERRLALAQIICLPFWMVIVQILGSKGFPRSLPAIYVALSILALIALRRGAAWFLNLQRTQLSARDRKDVLIFGAGREGNLLAESLVRQGRYRPVAFIDTDYTLIGRTMQGLKVYTMEELETAIKRHRPAEALIAKAGQSRSSKRVLLKKFSELDVDVKLVPDLNEITSGEFNTSAIRKINIEDLLGRDPVAPDIELMSSGVAGKSVMVTGAGGSIGSELVRQAVAFGAQKVVLVESSEFALFNLHREMEAKENHAAALVPLLLDVLDTKNLTSQMRTHAVDIVFHAAAYKHVRMVQENASIGIRNNVWGTKSVAEAAIAANVKRFILVSTDKAVRPTSVMGASKRVAELVVQALANVPKQKTIFSMVRFGNVLGSTGSVVPIFREQIANGGPIQVTDPEVTRYFMLIPEAAQLVIQAGAMANGGEVFVLDMGEPIKIVMLAETMIELAGLSKKDEAHPDGDIEIKFVGLRDGEKLFEELQIGEDVFETSHQGIQQSHEQMLELSELSKTLISIEKDLFKNEKSAVKKLFALC
jgi:UDP-N-acetylglucosamine 4,6-dehydratase